MKTIAFLIPLLGAALGAMAAETATTNSPATTTELSLTKDSTSTTAPAEALTATDGQTLQKVGERIAQSGAITKGPPSRARSIGELFNPFAPVEPKPQTRWLERTAWSTAAGLAAGSSTPEATRHEPHFGVVIASK